MKARYFSITVFRPFAPVYLCDDVIYMKGQAEECPNTGKLHYQVIVVMKKPMTLAQAVKFWGCYVQLSRSSALNDYVWKQETCLGCKFELGVLPFNRSSKRDWEMVRKRAREGNLDDIPADIYVRCYNQLKKIQKDNLVPVGIEKECYYYYGDTGTGKSHKAWTENPHAYPKDPRNKWWDGYNGQEVVIMDEFTAQIGIEHMLRWLDKWPVTIENKGGAMILKAKKIILTTNLSFDEIYTDVNQVQKDALKRRLTIVHFY